MHTVSSQDFRSLSFSVMSVGDFQHSIFFVKLQCSVLKNFHLTNFFFILFFFRFFFLKVLIASYGARVRGSVFKKECRVLSNEFESIETSPEFVQLLGENWN